MKIDESKLEELKKDIIALHTRDETLEISRTKHCSPELLRLREAIERVARERPSLNDKLNSKKQDAENREPMIIQWTPKS